MLAKLFVAFGLLCLATAIRIPTGGDPAPQFYQPQPIHHAPAPRLLHYQPAPKLVHHQPPQYKEIHYDHGPIVVQRIRTELDEHKEEKQDLNKIPGVAGRDYPIYHSVPPTSFSCHNVPAVPGMYANPETGCQAYHVCQGDEKREPEQGAEFLCTNGTLFNQAIFGCDWWYNVDCHQAQSLWRLNADPELNPYTPKKKLVDEHDLI